MNEQGMSGLREEWRRMEKNEKKNQRNERENGEELQNEEKNPNRDLIKQKKRYISINLGLIWIFFWNKVHDLRQ